MEEKKQLEAENPSVSEVLEAHEGETQPYAVLNYVVNLNNITECTINIYQTGNPGTPPPGSGG